MRCWGEEVSGMVGRMAEGTCWWVCRSWGGRDGRHRSTTHYCVTKWVDLAWKFILDCGNYGLTKEVHTPIKVVIVCIVCSYKKRISVHILLYTVISFWLCQWCGSWDDSAGWSFHIYSGPDWHIWTTFVIRWLLMEPEQQVKMFSYLLIISTSTWWIETKFGSNIQVIL